VIEMLQMMEMATPTSMQMQTSDADGLVRMKRTSEIWQMLMNSRKELVKVRILKI
jgi:uncharacterized protein GlcG (DUF336 family)